MPRVPEIDPGALPEDVRQALEERQRLTGSEPTWQKVAGHRPRQLKHILDLMGSFATAGVVPARLRELAVVTVSKANECQHCIGMHTPRLWATGMARETVAQLLDRDCPGLTDEERLVRDYALAVTRDAGRLRDVLFERLREKFDEAQIVELTLLITLASFFNNFNHAMQVELGDSHLAMLA
jgi:uncharacterized peroxidase-related enzyme